MREMTFLEARWFKKKKKRAFPLPFPGEVKQEKENMGK